MGWTPLHQEMHSRPFLPKSHMLQHPVLPIFYIFDSWGIISLNKLRFADVARCQVLTSCLMGGTLQLSRTELLSMELVTAAAMGWQVLKWPPVPDWQSVCWMQMTCAEQNHGHQLAVLTIKKCYFLLGKVHVALEVDCYLCSFLALVLLIGSSGHTYVI